MYKINERPLSESELRRFRKKLGEIETSKKFNWGCFGCGSVPVAALSIYGYCTQGDMAVGALLIGFAVIAVILSAQLQSQRDENANSKKECDKLQSLIDGQGLVYEYRILCDAFFVVEPYDEELDQYFLDLGQGSTLMIAGSYTDSRRFPTSEITILRYFGSTGDEIDSRTICKGIRLAPIEVLHRSGDADESVPYTEHLEFLESPFNQILAEVRTICD